MYRTTNQTQDLKIDIFELKKQLATVKDENQFLKVKIRKLQHEVNKKDKQIECLIDPRRSVLVKKVVSEKGAEMLICLQDENEKLYKILEEKEILVKRLQNNLRIKNLYGNGNNLKSADRMKNTINNKHIEAKNNPAFTVNYYDSESEKEDEVLKRFEQMFQMTSLYNVPENNGNQFGYTNAIHNTAIERSDYKDHNGVSHNFICIDELQNNEDKYSANQRIGESPVSDLERVELQCETPHPEIVQLQNYFIDMLSEVGQLKTTITGLQLEQEKTIALLHEKDSNGSLLSEKGKRRCKSEHRKFDTNSGSSLLRPPHKNGPPHKHHKKKSVAIKIVHGIEDVCNYRQTQDREPQGNENDLQIVNKTTFPNSNLENQNNLVLQTHCCLTLNNDEEIRRLKFNTLMEEMLKKTVQT